MKRNKVLIAVLVLFLALALASLYAYTQYQPYQDYIKEGRNITEIIKGNEESPIDIETEESSELNNIQKIKKTIQSIKEEINITKIIKGNEELPVDIETETEESSELNNIQETKKSIQVISYDIGDMTLYNYKIETPDFLQTGTIRTECINKTDDLLLLNRTITVNKKFSGEEANTTRIMKLRITEDGELIGGTIRNETMEREEMEKYLLIPMLKSGNIELNDTLYINNVNFTAKEMKDIKVPAGEFNAVELSDGQFVIYISEGIPGGIVEMRKNNNEHREIRLIDYRK